MRKTCSLLIIFALVLLNFSGNVLGGIPEGKPVKCESVEGPGWKKLVPLKSAILVSYDEDSILDDYAYLASVPASVFYSKVDNKIFSSPLIFYAPNISVSSDEERTLNHGQGVEYFMEDWMIYCDDELYTLQLINIDDSVSVRDKYPAKNFIEIKGKKASKIARDIASANWEYSRYAVIAVIKEKYEEINNEISGTLNGTIPANMEVKTEKFEGKKDVGITPIFHNFTVSAPYKYMTAHMEWHGGAGLGILDPITQRGKDPDLQIYDWQLGEVAASANWNVLTGPTEDAGTYIYHYGDWGVAVTYMPTESMGGTPAPPFPNPRTAAKYEIDVTLYPGVEIQIPQDMPFYGRDVYFELTWDNENVDLGIIIRGPEGAEIYTSELTGTSPQQVKIPEIGEGKYNITVLKIGGEGDAKFTVKYSCVQKKKIEEGLAYVSASNGAVLSSLLNAPLLYAYPDDIPQETLNALDLLGVEDVYVLDAAHLSNGKVAEHLRKYRTLFQPKLNVIEINDAMNIYEKIVKMTNTQYAIFTTINPFSYWNIGSKGPEGENPGALYIGPASYAAAHHGTPVLIVDVHPELSSPAAWYNIFWLHAYSGRHPPSVGCMVLTGKSIYSFLKEVGIDKKGKEYIMTVAGQFDIGTPWDRALVGAAYSGRIMGSPVDAAYWISRCELYPAIIFANPATSDEPLKMIDGTESNIDPGPERPGVKPIEGKEVEVSYPVVQTWVSYQHRFNERASKYWGTNYVSAKGIVPFWTPSNNSIDDGVNSKYGQNGAYWPDITTSEVVPFYVEKMGFTSVFSTNFKDTMRNLNTGTIMWIEVMHGGNRGAGVVGFWNDGPVHNEKNPWRGYESTGCTREPDTYTMNKFTGLDALHRSVSDYDKDGVVIAIVQQEPHTVAYYGTDFDDAMDNLHSMGFNGGSCLIANTYLHLTMVRHGSSFQIIDPWLTSWYSSFAMAIWARAMALNATVGEAYEEGISHVGIEYLVDGWWWDIYENVVFYGEPAMKIWSPKHAWDEPLPLEDGTVVSGHAPYGAKEHPYKVEPTALLELLVIAVVILTATAVIIIKWKKINVRKIIKKFIRK